MTDKEAKKLVAKSLKEFTDFLYNRGIEMTEFGVLLEEEGQVKYINQFIKILD